MADIKVSDGGKLADKLARAAARVPQETQALVTGSTLETHEAIVGRITNDIRPHSGLGRKNNPQPVVTDLVDTGAFRASWQDKFPAPFVGKTVSNIEYALPLEYGTEDFAGFFVIRDTAREQRPVFNRKARDLIRVALS